MKVNTKYSITAKIKTLDVSESIVLFSKAGYCQLMKNIQSTLSRNKTIGSYSYKKAHTINDDEHIIGIIVTRKE